jgi:hypothetical protein
MLVMIWAIRKGKKCVTPFILILLADAGLHLIWSSLLPWAWVYQYQYLRVLSLFQAVVLTICFVILFLPQKCFDVQNGDIVRVGIAVVLALAIIYVKGRFSFCCPQYGPTPPMWWVYFHISDLWDPRETGLLIMWACYTGILGSISLLGKAFRLHVAQLAV